MELDIPKGRLTVVTGVSGSGKTTMVLESLVPALEAKINGSALPAHIREIRAEGIAHVKIRAVRVAAMGPLGGIGDAIFWFTLVPITAGITSNMAINGSLAGPILFLLIFNIVQFACRFFLMYWSYNLGTKAIDILTANAKEFTRAASMLGWSRRARPRGRWPGPRWKHWAGWTAAWSSPSIDPKF